jgi:hypothetical protein
MFYYFVYLVFMCGASVIDVGMNRDLCSQRRNCMFPPKLQGAAREAFFIDIHLLTESLYQLENP